ncbi:MAG: T9SS type A sorting domain-containing protein [Bacteroidales bacterium]|nr:T9SS type A sorting domain-containing protein [Bacteroidales bacterium]
MKKFLYPLILTLILSVAVPATAAPAKGPVWDTVEQTEGALPMPQDAPLDVAVREGHIYISTTQPVKVEVFTILGQLVTSKTVNPGTVRLSLGQRGIYIVKGAGFARRVSL